MSFSLIILLFLAFGIITIKGLFTLGHLTRMIYEHPLVVSNASLVAALNTTKMHRSMKDVVLATSPDEAEVLIKAVAENEAIAYQQLDVIREAILGIEGQFLEKQTRQFLVNWKPIRNEVVRLLELGNRKDAILITKGKGADHVEKLEAKMLELTSYARNKADNFLKIAETNQSKLEKITVILTLTGVILSMTIAFAAIYLILKADKALQDKKNKLQKALDEIKTLRGIIPICSHCKQIKDDEGFWKHMEDYIHAHSEAEFSHGICPSCLKEHHPEYYETIYPDKEKRITEQWLLNMTDRPETS